MSQSPTGAKREEIKVSPDPKPHPSPASLSLCLSVSKPQNKSSQEGRSKGGRGEGRGAEGRFSASELAGSVGGDPRDGQSEYGRVLDSKEDDVQFEKSDNGAWVFVKDNRSPQALDGIKWCDDVYVVM